MANYDATVDPDAEYGRIMKQLAELESCPWSQPATPSAASALPTARPMAARACRSDTRLEVLNQLAAAIARMEDDAAKTFAQKTLISAAFPALMSDNGKFVFGVSLLGGAGKKAAPAKKKKATKKPVS